VEASLFVQGFVIGCALAAPVGPIALVCIQRTLAGGRLHGIISGLGVATADTFYAAVTAFGLTLVSGFLLSYQSFFRLSGGIVLVYIGYRIFRSRAPIIPAHHDHETYAKDYGSMVALTLTNLLTMLYFTIFFSGMGVVIGTGSWVPPAVFVAGVFAGEAAWWTILCSALGSVRTRITAERLTIINRIAGLIIAGLGVAMVVSVLVTAGSGMPGYP
jgi:threonine/homoserine/homoserine lactone efflux protein